MKPRAKGKFTFKTAGVLFVISALLEIFSINSHIPLFGNLRGGLVAATYHLIYAVLFFSLGFGLFKARPWAYRMVFVTTGLYTIDRLVYVLDQKALEIYLTTLLDKYGLSTGTLQTGFVMKVILLATVLIVACWWGFAGYTYLRRKYFHQTNGLKGPGVLPTIDQ